MASLFANKDAKVIRVPEHSHLTAENGTENLWQPLQEAIRDILEKSDSGQRFDDLYCSTNAMMTQEQVTLPHSALRKAVTDHLLNKVRPAVLALAHDVFMQTFSQAWNVRKSRITQITDIVLYLEQAYVPRHNVCSVHNLGLLFFRGEVAHHVDIRDKLREALLEKMSRDREPEMIGRLSMRNACEVLVKLGVNSRSVCEEDIERPFLAESAEFCAAESQEQLAEKSAIDYIDMAEQRMNEESERAKQVVYQELVANHVKAIVEKEDSGIVVMLKI